MRITSAAARREATLAADRLHQALGGDTNEIRFDRSVMLPSVFEAEGAPHYLFQRWSRLPIVLCGVSVLVLVGALLWVAEHKARSFLHYMAGRGRILSWSSTAGMRPLPSPIGGSRTGG